MSSPKERIDRYLNLLRKQCNATLGVANEARKKGYDYAGSVEIALAPDVAGRVEGIVGPKGISKEIRKLVSENKSHDEIAFEIARMIATGEFDAGLDLEKRVEQAVRTGVAVLTEGVLVAPTEGISSVKIDKNPDGSTYLAVYYSGPIRSAGGTAAALSVLLADYVRKFVDINDFIPTETELMRYVEEINLYDSRCSRLQYKPSDDDIKWIFKNCKVCINGEPTDEYEVSVHRNLERMGTNRVRGGVALVSCEGIALKARKVLKYAKKYELDWDWLQRLIKEKKASDRVEIKPVDSFLDGLVAGRPIFSYPSAKGGFRLRYGRTQYTGIAAKAIHPATMVLLDGFPALGTQLKIERPGKGTIATPCDSIMGPIVLLKNGDVVSVNNVEQAVQIKNEVSKILFLGDMLITYGDFAKSGHILMPSPFVEEIWDLIANKHGIEKEPQSAKHAFELSRKHGIPLHPKYLFFWSDLDRSDLKVILDALPKFNIEFEWFDIKGISVENGPVKQVFEKLGLEHKLRDGRIRIDGENAYALMHTLGAIDDNNKLDLSKLPALMQQDAESNVCELLSKASGIDIRKKSTYYIGGRMGRPEKAAERSMAGSVNGLFPIGSLGGKLRSAITALKSQYSSSLNVDIIELKCNACGKVTHSPVCQYCGAHILYDINNVKHSIRPINFKEIYENAVQKCNYAPDELKLIRGLTNDTKIPEPFEKCLLRAKYDLHVFKDGTCRFDSTDFPATHFKPSEIGVSVDKLRELGYTHDYKNEPLESEEQVVELYPQDIILSENAADLFLRVARFIDDLLIHVYGMKPFYNANKKEDLIGHLFITLSPHTSAGVLGRLIGFVKGRIGISHPYVICARRRNCDGDEDSAMLLLDAFLNFSKLYLPSTRGGTMDASIVLTTIIDPAEVDDEVHVMEVCNSYDLDFYEAADNYLSPNKVKVETVADRLGKDNEFYDIQFTHKVSSIIGSPVKSEYVQLKTMKEKIERQFELYEKIRALDIKDSAARLLSSHFIPDIYGNLRSFTRQRFRCANCNMIYRRPPLSGKCDKCGGKLLLTIHKGGIEKYIKLAKYLIQKYELPDYNLQRIKLVEDEIESIFEDETKKQSSLAQFM